ncbi:TetR/AcrR family transcriptional regulator [Mycobacterium sp. MYCO198283]|uniref:TetR/AcrR family transcriptional regulator n=1 Tax=Mycobacterium sp. MYCO198283 TaxID=2883505 RepID=UPI001E588A6D|nr:TetR/AcrR family transcriptional regulator [Mycobacterium sp. MYCO198283]MCG5431308.1 TetR/AcrR family transcriptional regulator [Mycobacterium sp. MYCO198283]
MTRRRYHHGDLRAVLLGEAAKTIAERGADAVSLRELARQAGVSHAAPAHHFSDRRGLFTALAAEGFRKLADALAAAPAPFENQATAYVTFATTHRGHYAVMFDRTLVDVGDPELRSAQAAAGEQLSRGVATLTDPRAVDDPAGAELAAWSLVHGFAMLWNNGAAPQAFTGASPRDTAERIARMLFGG